MPAGTKETSHDHQQAQQFFFILKGNATFEIDKEKIIVIAQERIHINAGSIHQINNETDEELEFLLSSQPSTINDRFVL